MTQAEQDQSRWWWLDAAEIALARRMATSDVTALLVWGACRERDDRLYPLPRPELDRTMAIADRTCLLCQAALQMRGNGQQPLPDPLTPLGVLPND